MLMSWESWALFVTASLMLNLTPGPDMIFTLTRTIGYGKRVGMAAATGMATGAFIHVIAAALGLSAILATSATAFLVVKYIGAAYLIYLGLKALLSAKGGLNLDKADSNTTTCAKDAKSKPFWSSYRQGMLIDVLNPKVALFFLAFLPQFIPAASPSIFTDTMMLGMVVVISALTVFSILVFLAAPMGNFLRNNNHIAQWVDRAFGGLLVGLGIKLALSEQ